MSAGPDGSLQCSCLPVNIEPAGGTDEYESPALCNRRLIISTVFGVCACCCGAASSPSSELFGDVVALGNESGIIVRYRRWNYGTKRGNWEGHFSGLRDRKACIVLKGWAILLSLELLTSLG
jgi:hypothetical protein